MEAKRLRSEPSMTRSPMRVTTPPRSVGSTLFSRTIFLPVRFSSCSLSFWQYASDSAAALVTTARTTPARSSARRSSAFAMCGRIARRRRLASIESVFFVIGPAPRRVAISASTAARGPSSTSGFSITLRSSWLSAYTAPMRRISSASADRLPCSLPISKSAWA